MINKKVLFIALTIGLLGTGVIGVSVVRADTTTSWHQSLIAKLAAKFNVSETVVQSVFDETRNEQQAQRTQTLTDKLTQAVKDGKITESQKKAILDFHSKMQQERESDRKNWQNLSLEQRKAQRESRKTEMEAKRTEMETWAKTNGIDLTILSEILGGFGPGGEGRGRGMGMGKGMMG